MKEDSPRVYLSTRIAWCTEASQLEDELVGQGIKVENPCHIMPSGIPPADRQEVVSRKCYEMIDRSDAVVLLTSGEDGEVGRDCTVEVGYATAQSKPVFAYGKEEDFRLLFEKELEETISTGRLQSRFMLVGSIDQLRTIETSEELVEKIRQLPSRLKDN
jgi:nucleoside 2-deoxyribosyltransferase